MKKTITLLTALLFTNAHFLMAQSSQPSQKKVEEITIMGNGGNDMNFKVEVIGDSVIVNGKPLQELNDKNVTIKKKKMIIKGDNGTTEFSFDGNDDGLANNDFLFDKNKKALPFLGVATEKKTMDEMNTGALITEVIKESAAEKAGLQKNDIITKIDDLDITDPSSLTNTILLYKPQDKITVEYKRNGKSKKTKVILGEKKDNASPSFKMISPEDMGGLNFSEGMPFFKNFDWNSEMPKQKKIGLKIQDTEEGKNVKVVKVEEGSAAEKSGIKEGDIILNIDGVATKNTDDAREQLKMEETKTKYVLKISRNKQEMDIEIKIPKEIKTLDL